MAELFKKILPEERELLLQKALKEKAFFVFKGTQKAIKSKINDLKRPNYITCVCPAELMSLRTRQDVIVVMVLGEERYFFKSFVFADDGFLLFKRKVDFYHLVRRKDKRQRLPNSFPASLMIKRLNGNLSFLKGIVLDFSDKGCRLGLNTEVPKLQVGDDITGNLKMGERRAVEVTGTIKHHVKSKSGALKQTFGLNFQFPHGHASSLVKSLFLDLQRELFVEFYGKQ
ncbi:MAG: PilZ domain-containing protein [Bdellovibrionaceae bacterium]|nr:PilZ domain-containing protein [Pseudobdellovibrionaceae bacterium]